MRFWGITGTNGKTTTTWIAAEFINASHSLRAGHITTVEAFDGVRRFYTGYTTPPLAKLREIYAAMEANGCTDCVMEVSSHAIHQNRVGFGETTTFAGGAFTNLSEDHLDYHKTMKEYFRVKLSFAERIAEGGLRSHGWKDGPPASAGRRDFPVFAVCLDGGYGDEMLSACGRLPLNVMPVTCRSPRYDLSGLKLIGDYNRSNVLVAAAIAESAGVPREVIQATIPKIEPRWGRLERVENTAVKAEVYVDFAHTPDGLEKVLSAVRKEMSRTPRIKQSNNQTTKQSNNLLWVVFGAGGDRDPMKRPLMGEVCARLADRLVVTSDNPRSEDPMSIIKQIMDGVNGTSGMSGTSATVTVEPDRAKAIEYALANSAEGDVVVIAGKGHETTQEIAGVKYPFDDREVVRRAFAERSGK